MTELQRRYARALYDCRPDEDALRAALETFCPPLRAALENPCVTQEEKQSVLDRVLDGQPPEVLRLMKLLCRNGRLGLLPGIADALHDLILAREGAARGVLRTATTPDPAQVEALSAALARRRGLHRVELLAETDPALLGGFTVELGGVTYDHSLLGSLRALGQALK